MKNPAFKTILALAGLALAAAPALRADQPSVPPAPPADQPGHHGRREEMRERFQRMITDLNLTPDQQAKGQAILKQTAESLKAIHEDATLSDEQKRAKAKELRRSTEQQIHALLTPDQQAKLKELRQQHHQTGTPPPPPPTT